MTLMQRWGEACGRRPGRVMLGWLAALIVITSLSHFLGPTYSDNVTLGATNPAIGAALLTASDPAASGSTGTVVFYRSAGVSNYQSVIRTVDDTITHLAHVLSVSNPFTNSDNLSKDGTTAYSVIHFGERPKLLGTGFLRSLDAATLPATTAGLQVELGGGLDELTRPAVSDKISEIVGLLVALLVLVLMFGSLLGALVPLVSAFWGVLIGLGVLGVVATLVTFGTASPTLAIMIGLGVGIDYAVFLTTRFRQLMMDSVPPVQAAGLVVNSSGRAVLVAATTVGVALLGLYGSGITFVGQLGLGSVFGVVAAAAGALTLVPAALAFTGRRIDRWTLRQGVAEAGTTGDGWHRYSALIGRHPWRFLLLGSAAVCTFAFPLLSLQTGHVGDGADPVTFTDRRAYDLISRGFGPGANGPFTVVVDVGRGASAQSNLAHSLVSAISATKDVAHVSSAIATADGKLLVISVVALTGPQAAQTGSLYNILTSVTLPRALAHTTAKGYVTGATASQVQFDTTVSSRTPIIVIIVILVAFMLILMAFRSLFLAIKAAILNLMSIGAAYGVVVAIFQWGWGRQALGITENVPIEAYVPMMMFAIVFGLSMDYEIFLLSRVKEAWDRSGDNHQSVAEGLATTGRVISAAALIMVSVFLSFSTSALLTVKELSIGLAASVVIDATIVRLVLVPATMFLFGRWNWWLPTWLERVVPHLSVEAPATSGVKLDVSVVATP